MNNLEIIEISSKNAKQFYVTSDNKNCRAEEPLEDGNVLIVGREIGKSVIIGDVVKVTVLQFGSMLRLAIDAPKKSGFSEKNCMITSGQQEIKTSSLSSFT